MSDSYELVGEHQPTTDLVPAQDIQNLLPVLVSDNWDQSGPKKINYQELLKRDADMPLVAALMHHEVETLQYGQNSEDDQKATRLSRSASGILDLVDSGNIEKMSDAWELIGLVEEVGPSIHKVKELMTELGYTATGVCYIYDVKDMLGLSIVKTDQVFRRLGLDLTDENEVSIVDDAIDSIIKHRNIPYRDTAAEILIELHESGLTLVEIMHGKVY